MMSSSRGLRTKIRAYQYEHGVNFTTARRAVLEGGSGGGLPEPFAGSIDDLPPLLMSAPEKMLTVPSGLSPDEKLNAVMRAALDYLDENAWAWPARDDDGRFAPPPDDHVRHHLAVSYDLGEEEEIAILPAMHTVAVVDELRECLHCLRPGRYDAYVVLGDRKTHARLCEQHYERDGSGVLGSTGDVYLMLWDEVPAEVQSDVNAHMVARGREPMVFE
jgi:hypothetical protein